MGWPTSPKKSRKPAKKAAKPTPTSSVSRLKRTSGRNCPDTIGKATKGGGGIEKAAKDAADEFGKGFGDGIDQALAKTDIDDKLTEAFKKGGVSGSAQEFGKGYATE